MKQWIKPHLLHLEPYASARSLGEIQDGIWLDANENRWGNVLQQDTWSRYPTYRPALRELWADFLDIPPDQLLLTHGSDEGIDLIFKLCGSPGDVVCGFSPTYGMYRVMATIYGCPWFTIPLTELFELPTNFTWPVEAKLLFICRPNNPTGNSFSLEELLRLIHSFPGLVVIDEAYQEFSNQPSALSLLPEFPQLLVMRTLSKAFGLAGLRLGALVAVPDTIQWLRKIQLPYPITAPSLEAGADALRQTSWMQQKVEGVKEQRQFVHQRLKDMPGIIKVFPSETNFLLFQMDEPTPFVAFAKQNGLVLRDRSQEAGCNGCVRVTIGLPEENLRFLQILNAFLSL